MLPPHPSAKESPRHQNPFISLHEMVTDADANIDLELPARELDEWTTKEL
ncbi:hypothetical protein [Corynebacterium sp. Marseille-P4321]|nr:hypothetical protein [Corynebacterium sp. Marseille-P4321]